MCDPYNDASKWCRQDIGQCRPWSDCSFTVKLFTQTSLSEYSGIATIKTIRHQEEDQKNVKPQIDTQIGG